MSEKRLDFLIKDPILNTEYHPVVSDELFSHLKYNLKTEIKCSPVHGVGVFTIKDIKEGEQLFPIWTGETKIYALPIEQYNQLDDEVKRLISMYFITKGTNDYVFIRMVNGVNFITCNNVFFNSCYPNMENQNINNYGFSTRDIKKGEELFDIYSDNL